MLNRKKSYGEKKAEDILKNRGKSQGKSFGREKILKNPGKIGEKWYTCGFRQFPGGYGGVP
jgi:hypothetical protein